MLVNKLFLFIFGIMLISLASAQSIEGTVGQNLTLFVNCDCTNVTFINMIYQNGLNNETIPLNQMGVKDGTYFSLEVDGSLINQIGTYIVNGFVNFTNSEVQPFSYNVEIKPAFNLLQFLDLSTNLGLTLLILMTLAILIFGYFKVYPVSAGLSALLGYSLLSNEFYLLGIVYLLGAIFYLGGIFKK